MAKDALGHGSEAKQAPEAPEAPMARERPMAKEAAMAKQTPEAAMDSRVRGVKTDVREGVPPGAQGAMMIVRALGLGHPKSQPVPVHGGAQGRGDPWPNRAPVQSPIHRTSPIDGQYFKGKSYG